MFSLRIAQILNTIITSADAHFPGQIDLYLNNHKAAIECVWKSRVKFHGPCDWIAVNEYVKNQNNE